MFANLCEKRRTSLTKYQTQTDINEGHMKLTHAFIVKLIQLFIYYRSYGTVKMENKYGERRQ